MVHLALLKSFLMVTIVLSVNCSTTSTVHVSQFLDTLDDLRRGPTVPTYVFDVTPAEHVLLLKPRYVTFGESGQPVHPSQSSMR